MYQHQQACPTCGSCPTCGRQARPFSPGFYPYWGGLPYTYTYTGNAGQATGGGFGGGQQTITTNVPLSGTRGE